MLRNATYATGGHLHGSLPVGTVPMCLLACLVILWAVFLGMSEERKAMEYGEPT